jgi:hypothetical protein
MIFIRPCRDILISADANARIIPQRLYSWTLFYADMMAASRTRHERGQNGKLLLALTS